MFMHADWITPTQILLCVISNYTARPVHDMFYLNGADYRQICVL